MNIIIAIDSFKGSISSIEAGNTVKDAILASYPNDAVRVFPLADGGEGTVDALTQGLGGRIMPVTVTGPLGEPAKSRYGYLPDRQTAVIEMADAAGLAMVPATRRNPLHTTTYGLGELIIAAMEHGCRHFIIGIGGSATNDAGLGMLSALGYRFYLSDGTPCGICGKDLHGIAAIDASHCHPLLKECKFEIACDVVNPLCGEQGCSAIYGPQKGATPEIIATMDKDIAAFAALAENTLAVHGANPAENIPAVNNAELPESDRPIKAAELSGAGAAGGLGFAFHAFLHGSLTPGIELVLKAIGIEQALCTADILITGEGRMDGQTAMGKAPVGIAQLAKKCQPDCLTIGLCGCATHAAEAVNEHGIDAYFPILHAPMSVEEAMASATTRQNLAQTIQQVMHVIHH